MKIDVCHGLSRKRSSDVLSVWKGLIERLGRSKLIETNLTEPDVELSSLSLVCLMKSSTFGLGLKRLKVAFIMF